mgnify:CR=1 FL=1
MLCFFGILVYALVVPVVGEAPEERPLEPIKMAYII